MPKRSKSKSKKKSRKTRSKLRGGAAIPRTVEQLDRELTEALERVGETPQDIYDDLNRVPYRIQRDYLNKYTFEDILRDKCMDKYYEEIANIILSDYPDSIDKRELIRTIKFADLNMKGILQSSKSFPQDISDRLSEEVASSVQSRDENILQNYMTDQQIKIMERWWDYKTRGGNIDDTLVDLAEKKKLENKTGLPMKILEKWIEYSRMKAQGLYGISDILGRVYGVVGRGSAHTGRPCKDVVREMKEGVHGPEWVNDKKIQTWCRQFRCKFNPRLLNIYV